MNLKFRKKPVVIEAFQMTEDRRASNADWPEWMHRAWQLDPETPGSLYPTEEGTSDGTLSIGTLENAVSSSGTSKQYMDLFFYFFLMPLQ